MTVLECEKCGGTRLQQRSRPEYDWQGFVYQVFDCLDCGHIKKCLVMTSGIAMNYEVYGRRSRRDGKKSRRRFKK